MDGQRLLKCIYIYWIQLILYSPKSKDLIPLWNSKLLGHDFVLSHRLLQGYLPTRCWFHEFRVVPTCLPSVFHGGLVGGLSVELVEHKLLVLLRNRSLFIGDVHRWLVPRSAFWVGGSPALRSMASCRNKRSKRLWKMHIRIPLCLKIQAYKHTKLEPLGHDYCYSSGKVSIRP